MNKLPISVTIITFNEEERLPLVLDPLVNLVDEIIVVDSGSSDDTLQIAEKSGCLVFHRDWTGFGDQKVFAEKKCRNNWVLNLDADEILLPSIIRSLKTLFRDHTNLKPAVYKLAIRHVSHLSNSRHPLPFAPTNWTPRLYHREVAGFSNSTVHDKVIPKSTITPTKLKGDVAHISLKSFSHMWEKIATYSALQAEVRVEKGRSNSIALLFLDPPFFFLKNYFFRRLCFVGLEGLVMSFALSAGRALRIGMAREIAAKRLPYD
jgi:glycosyltransferase involved in cell wall biosynthesis